MPEKVMFINSNKGRIPRPKKQDIKPKGLRLPPAMMIANCELNERFILRIIANYPYLYNSFFMCDTMGVNGNNYLNPESKFAKGLQLIAKLKDKGWIKQSKDLMKFRITFSGYIYRITSHSAFPIVAPATAITMFVLSFILVFLPLIQKGCSGGKDTQTTNLHADSARNTVPHTEPLKVRIAFL
jgi:hypothetical protein